MVDRHKSPRLAPLSIDQEDMDKIKDLSEHIGLPVAWVHRKLLKEALDEVNMDNLPKNIFRR